MADNCSESLLMKRDVSVWCSNDDLGMSRRPRAFQAIIKRNTEHPHGPVSSRSTWSKFQVNLEYELADLGGKDAALLCTSRHNAGNRASVMQGIRNSESDPTTLMIVAFEMVHSMDADSNADSPFSQCAGALVGRLVLLAATSSVPMPWCPGALVDTVYFYAVGFIFTSLPPMLLALAWESIQTLNGEEGRVLRRKHQRNVKLLHQIHIIPVRVSLAYINYPMVARGEEGLRIAPTPHHTPQVMQYFFEHLVKAWKEVGLELKLHSSGECNFCQQPLDFELMTEREKSSP
uniref:Uncharacterized protein n=1 Tax=Oncorhynchus tshawytscha TaxID=74940 RepID=A0AAZ3SAE0_ONCTS